MKARTEIGELPAKRVALRAKLGLNSRNWREFSRLKPITWAWPSRYLTDKSGIDKDGFYPAGMNGNLKST